MSLYISLNCLALIVIGDKTQRHLPFKEGNKETEKSLKVRNLSGILA